MYTWITLDSKADLQKLTDIVDPEYSPDDVVRMLEDGMSPTVKAVLVEHYYVDKDYRSTYYKFYSKKGLHYRKDCVRLHFFDETVEFNEDTLQLSYAPAYKGDINFTDHYFGYMVLRPTGVTTIGRSVINADIILGAKGRIIDTWHKVHVLGYKLFVRGFPWMQQHIDISRCAHAACWAILRYYSERFPNYREHLLHEITTMAHPYDPGGLIPSLGLSVLQAERVFQEAGVYPMRIARDDDLAFDTSFYRQLAAYVESGFPLFVGMHDPSIRHAVAIVGYRWSDAISPNHGILRYAWDEIDHFLVIDDNRMPYLSIQKQGPRPAHLYTIEDIDKFIIPFPEKLFYPAEAIEEQLPTLFAFDGFLNLPSESDSIVRYFITTGASFQRFVRDHESAYDQHLLEIIMDLPFSQFVWIVEIATEAQWAVGNVAARAVLDASASITEEVPLWLFQAVDKALIFNREQIGLDLVDRFQELDIPGSAGFTLTRMETNLTAVRSK